ncbi:MAG: response regulator [Anaerolineae bacterium]
MVVGEDTVHELLSHLRDIAYLSAHPLAQALDPSGLHRGEHLRQLLLELIDDLRPAAGTAATDPSWRPHLALRMRYVEQQSAFRVQSTLSLSERQVRREQSRGIAALVALLQAAVDAAMPAADALSPEALTQAAEALHITPTMLDARHEMDGVAAVLAPRLAECRARLAISGPESVPLFADRIALRQVLIRLLGALAAPALDATIAVDLASEAGETRLCFRIRQAAGAERTVLANDTIAESDYLAGLSHGRVWQEQGRDGTSVWCVFPTRRPVVVLVIDDEAAAVHLVRRYVEGLGFRVVGLDDPREAYAVTVDVSPAVILLDVLMSGRDGWEVLQQLKALPETRAVPIIVCSVWNEPELAQSLGATAFIRKPVTRSLLLEALRRVLPTGSEPAPLPERS